MANAVSPSEVKLFSRGQAGKLADLMVAATLKLGLPSKEGQEVLEAEGGEIAKACAEIFRQHVEARMNTIIRIVTIDPSRTPIECVDATARVKYGRINLVKKMSRSPGGRVKLEGVKLDKWTSVADVSAWQNASGYRAATFDEVLKLHKNDPSFADKRPNFTQEKDVDGKFTFVACDRWRSGKRRVVVSQNDSGWDVGWLPWRVRIGTQS